MGQFGFSYGGRSGNDGNAAPATVDAPYEFTQFGNYAYTFDQHLSPVVPLLTASFPCA
ncbi:hypothetical protein GCM10010261_66460 [Streptomyces pilosus]|uniref:Uncharacterized protein n=1 Tax=Streptomyces pilosus TaxID=28893 RepID=A0A918BGW4_9ACTN|nr:hypothetical protein GCM10010280_10780 [Streptomyces pilosus]GGV70860.1 hypothetical protein GCM10010261_66460 [Streptomyces pilosus]